MKFFEYCSYGINEMVAFEPAKYQNGRLALQMMIQTGEGQLEPYGVPTVNFPDADVLDDCCAFVDENNFPEIGLWFLEQGMRRNWKMLSARSFRTMPADTPAGYLRTRLNSRTTEAPCCTAFLPIASSKFSHCRPHPEGGFFFWNNLENCNIDKNVI